LVNDVKSVTNPRSSQAGGGIASAISGAIWTNQMPKKLLKGLQDAGIANATTIAQNVYKSPLTFVKANPPGSPAREAVVNSYRDVQRTLAIIGVCIAALCVPLALLMDNVPITDKRNNVEGDDVSETSIEIEKREAKRQQEEEERAAALAAEDKVRNESRA